MMEDHRVNSRLIGNVLGDDCLSAPFSCVRQGVCVALARLSDEQEIGRY